MIAVALLPAMVVGLVLGYFLHDMTLQRDVLSKILGQCNDAMRTDARRIRVLRDDSERRQRLLIRAADEIVLMTTEKERLRIELAESRHALAVQIAAPEDRMALLGNNVVPIRGAR